MTDRPAPDGDSLIARPPDSPERPRADHARATRFAIEAAQTLRDAKCEDLLVLDVAGVSQVTDLIVIGTGSSDRQMASAIGHVEDLAKQQGVSTYGTNTDERSTWMLADFVDVVVHLFEPNARAHYDLEMLWGDAPRVEIPEGPGPLTPRRPGTDDA